MRWLMIIAATVESLVGLILLLVPGVFVRLILGVEPTGIAVPLARLGGIALIGLALTCWPVPPRMGILVYNALVAVFLVLLGLTGQAGTLLWPAAAFHGLMTVGLALKGAGTSGQA